MTKAGRTRPLTRADARHRARQAADFLETATDAATLHPERANVVVSNAVLAAIAASDAICGWSLGLCARGDSHEEAVHLLRGVAPDGVRHANDLRRLLALKTSAQYSPALISGSTAADAVRWATRLVDAARQIVD